MAVRDFASECAASVAADEPDRVRDALRLMLASNAPPGLADPVPDAARIEAMLLLGAAESAAIALIGPDTAFMLSRGINGSNLASVVLADGTSDFAAQGASLALSLLCAWASSLVAEKDRYDARPGGPSLRLH